VLDDLKYFDTVLYNSLSYINEASIDSDSLIEQYFVHEHKDGSVHELAVDGASIRVTDDNKMQYTLVKIEYLTRDIVIDQLQAMKKGFNKIIPAAWLLGFKPEELERAICGTSHISVDEWRASTQYRGSYHAGHKVIGWFWDALETYSQEELSKFLQFCTGTSRLPVGGFSAFEALRGGAQPFTIEYEYFSKSSPYPRAHTCFNRIDLPQYPSYKELKKNLDFVVQQGQIYGFGLED
jgi:hypothetical protein